MPGRVGLVAGYLTRDFRILGYCYAKTPFFATRDRASRGLGK